MSRFLTNPELRVVPGVSDARGMPVYELTGDLQFEIGPHHSGLVITVPAGFMSNLGTVPAVPALLWHHKELTLPNGRYVQATVLHDMLCNERVIEGTGIVKDPSGFTRLEAANIFRWALVSLGAPLRVQLPTYWAVRLNDYWVERRQLKDWGRAG